MAAAAKARADPADIGCELFGAQADTHFSLVELFKKCRNGHSADRADMIDQSFIVFGQRADFRRSAARERDTGHLVVGGKAQSVEQSAQELEAAPWVALIHFLREIRNVHARPDELRGD